MTAPELYVREGSRFVRVDDSMSDSFGQRPTLPVPPIPAPLHVVDDAEPGDPRPNYHRVHAPRCPHGSFARWAARNCCAPKEPRRAR